MLRLGIRVCPILFVLSSCGESDSPEVGRLQEASQVFQPEQEPNGAVGNATTIIGSNVVLRSNIYPSGDNDYYSFTGAAGDRIYAATSGGIGDSVLTLLMGDGTMVVESDNDNGSFNGASSTISGALLPSTGTYYLRVNHPSAAGQIRPYELHFQRRSGSPTVELEPNDTSAQPIGSGWIAGNLSTLGDVDHYSIDLSAGDTVFLSLDLDPERDDPVNWNGSVGLGPFAATFLIANDGGDEAGADSEAQFITVKSTGTYTVRVAASGTFGTYHLSASVHPASPPCTTYTSNVGATIPNGPASITSTLNVPTAVIIGDVDVTVQLTHDFMNDLDAVLTAPGGNSVGLFTDVGPIVSAPATMDVTLDDEAAIPISSFTVTQGMMSQPEPNYRLSWFDGQQAQGTWTLRIFDDFAGDGGTLQSWGLTICPEPSPPACPTGMVPRTIYATDFEANDGGFTHSGTADEWARGTPNAAPFVGCNSGVNCFKTDLINTYDASSSQDLLSPSIDLSGVVGPVTVRWAQKHQLENPLFDHAFVDVRNAGGASPRRLFEWLDPTMTEIVGDPTVTVHESAGWGYRTADISTYVGSAIELVFHLDSDTTNNFGGLAIDDVTVVGCGGAGGTGGAAGAGGASGTSGAGGNAGAGGAVAGAGGMSGAGGGVAGAAGVAGSGGVAGTSMGGSAGESGAGAAGDAGAGTGGEAGAGAGGEAGSSETGGTSTGGSSTGGSSTGGSSTGGSSTSGAGGVDATGGTQGNGKGSGSDEDSGCGCSVPGRSNFGSLPAVVGLAFALLVGRRLRQRR